MKWTDGQLRDFVNRRGRKAVHGADVSDVLEVPRQAAGSPAEEAFAAAMERAGLDELMRREYKFHAKRRWRFDFAWPRQRFAVEIEGVTHDGGRHQRIKGFEADAEKYEAAMLAGWCVYRVPGTWHRRGMWREETIDAVRTMLARRQRRYPGGY